MGRSKDNSIANCHNVSSRIIVGLVIEHVAIIHLCIVVNGLPDRNKQDPS